MLALKTYLHLILPPAGLGRRAVCASLAIMFLVTGAVAWWRLNRANTLADHSHREVKYPAARLSNRATIRTIGGVNPRVSLRDGHDLLTSYRGSEHLKRALTENQ